MADPRPGPRAPRPVDDRVLGRTGIAVGALGIGTWQIGGPMTSPDGRPMGWGGVDDDESVTALRHAADLGVTLFDTADSYGAGHAEEVLGRALGSRRDDLVWVTKWGKAFDVEARRRTGDDDSPAYARQALEASLRRLGTDRVDVWLLHLHDTDPDRADELAQVCEEAVAAGLVRCYGWSVDDPARARRFARRQDASVVEFQMDVLDDHPGMVASCDELDLGALVRSPLAMGLLADPPGQALPDDDIRRRPPAWLRWWVDGEPSPDYARRRDAVREVLTSDGRSLAQGALAWVWGRSPRTVPLPGCRSVAEVESAVAAARLGPLAPAQMAQVEALLDRGADPV